MTAGGHGAPKVLQTDVFLFPSSTPCRKSALIVLFYEPSEVTTEALEDLVGGLGPDEGAWVVVILFEEGTNVLLESDGASMDPPLQLSTREYGEPRFDEIEPGGVCWCEVEVKPRVPQ